MSVIRYEIEKKDIKLRKKLYLRQNVAISKKCRREVESFHIGVQRTVPHLTSFWPLKYLHMYAPHLPVAQGRSERKKKDEHVR